MHPDLELAFRGDSKSLFFRDVQDPTNSSISIMDAHMYCVGRSSIPDVFHRWAMLSIISSCVMNRVGIDMGVSANPITPQLYVMLMATSGVGKGVAIASALSYLHMNEDPALLHDCNVLMGEFTSAAIHDFLRRREDASGKFYKPIPHCFLVAEELKNSLKDRHQADRVIALLTAMYGGKPMHVDATRTAGITTVYNSHINLLAGTTEDWLTATLDARDLRGGFGPRTMFIFGYPDDDWAIGQNLRENIEIKSLSRIEKPPDKDAITGLVRQRLRNLLTIQGPFRATKQAVETLQTWLSKRKRPTDEDLQGVYNREVEVLIRLSMLRRLCYALEPKDLVIDLDDLKAGLALLREGQRGYKRILELSYMTPDLEREKKIELRLMKAKKALTTREIQGSMSRKGVTAQAVKQVIHALESTGVVRLMPPEDCKRFYGDEQTRYYHVDRKGVIYEDGMERMQGKPEKEKEVNEQQQQQDEEEEQNE